MPLSLDNVPLSSIRRYFRKTMHLMQAYREGCSYKLAMFAHKKHKTHRKISKQMIDAIVADVASVGATHAALFTEKDRMAEEDVLAAAEAGDGAEEEPAADNWVQCSKEGCEKWRLLVAEEPWGDDDGPFECALIREDGCNEPCDCYLDDTNGMCDLCAELGDE